MAAKKKKASSGRRYSRGASAKIGAVMHEQKERKLRSGRSGRKVTSRKQAIAIGLSEARAAGEKVPPPRKRTAKKAGAKASTARRYGAKKKAGGKTRRAKSTAASS